MKRFTLVLLALFVSAPLFAQTANQAQLRLTVVDETGAAIPSAAVTVTPNGGAPLSAMSDERGTVSLPAVPVGDARLHIEFPGFETIDQPLPVRRGTNNQTVTLKIAGLQEQVVVSDASSVLDDRSGNSFTTTLDEAEIEQLPDDPDDLQAYLEQMTGGRGAVFQVNGFRGGRLPSRDEIRQIRFRTNSFSADNHDAGRVQIEIITKPNTRDWSGNANLGIRNDVLNARNAFATTKPPEEINRFNMGLRGPLVAGKTAIRLNVDGNRATESDTIYALTTDGGRLAQAFQRPSDRTNVSAGIEHALTKNQTLRLEYRDQEGNNHNLGVGGFNLQDRAYQSTNADHQLRAQVQGLIGKKLNEFRFQFDAQRTNSSSAFNTPTIVVLDAFSTGGAGVASNSNTHTIEVADNLDFSLGRKHAMRVGFLLDGGTYSNFDARNEFGTFTFSSLDAYLAGRPTQFTQRQGEVQTNFSSYNLGVYWQDDIRVNKNFSYSLGVREEMQTLIDKKLNLMPRFGFTWTPIGPKTSFRGGYGMFYDWYNTSLYDQTLRVNGIAQRDLLILNPGYPDPNTGALLVLPGGRTQAASDLKLPFQHQASFGVERQIATNFQVQVTYQMLRGVNQLRAVNVNAPDANGVRPEPTVGNVTQIESTGKSSNDNVNFNASFRIPSKRMFVNANYTLGRIYNYTDSALQLPANSLDPNAEWGPASSDIRNRFNVQTNLPMPANFRLNLQVNAQSGLPYTIITGRDDNQDGIISDRPVGVGRNSARGASQWTANMRFGRVFSFGGPRAGAGGGQGGNRQGGGARPNGGGGGARQQAGFGGGGRPGGRGGPGGINPEGGANQRFNVEFYAQGNNLFNRTNFTAYSGNELSPLFGQAIAAAQARRIEVGLQFRF